MDWKSSIHPVSSLDVSALEPYRTLRRPLEHRKAGIFVAEGEKVVRRLLASSLTIESLLLTQRWLSVLEPELRARFSNGRSSIYVADQKLLESIVGFNLHQGIMAVARIPEAKSLREVFGGQTSPCMLVALDGLVNSENVGVVVRNAAAFGADAVVVGETSSSPYLRRAVRNSMGGVFQVPIVQVDDLVGGLQSLRDDHRTTIIAAHPRGERSIREAEWGERVCFVFGNEGDGVSPEVLAICDRTISIPMLNETDSLNVASACAVFLYEARRRRESIPPSHT